MTRAAAAARFRQRKLSTKQTLAVVREDQVDKVDDDPQRNIPKVETGVEKGEEIEHHLQAAISASQAAAIGGKVAQILIPTPDTIRSSLQYDNLYQRCFSQPATYIRFSSTVEDCTGCQYNLDEEDDSFLASMNQKRALSTQCTEDQFEVIMAFFETTAQSKQPFAAVDSPPVVSFEEMEGSFDESIDESIRIFTKEVYQHWKTERIKRGNRPLTPSLKFETGQEKDDSDPYVCFRRREVRAVRKTRGRDAQSAEKLRKLRKELELARHGLAMVKQREMLKKDILASDRQIFEERVQVKEEKRRNGFKDDDEDLINQKPQKRRHTETPQLQRPSVVQPRIPSRQDGRSAEADLIPLQDMLAEKENEINRKLEEKITNHNNWNKGYLDLTRMPLTPTIEHTSTFNFRSAVTEYLPTPPASVTSETSGNDTQGQDESPTRGRGDTIIVRYASPTYDGPPHSQLSFRRRRGRGGRILVDRRGLRLQSPEDIDPIVLDRFKYDQDDEDEQPTYVVDPYDTASMRYRATMLPISHKDHAAAVYAQSVRRQQQQDILMANSQSTAGASGQQRGHPPPTPISAGAVGL
ncbi:MAG: Enhancer of polycomb-like protein 1 [Geoglossum umbratile]|nr:MAG: Enhancer of polycomb-like protein 1 [Geoglossum umbratile]